jgi:polyhydroxyalkanoate synthase subunit PhaC
MGKAVDLRRITVPLMAVAATKDDIVPPGSARPLIDLASSDDKRFLELPGGHISVIAGRRARGEVWPTVLKWLQDHDA